MKIALVAEQASQLIPSRGRTAPDGGPAHGLVPLAGALAGLGHDVTVYARRDAGSQPTRSSLVPGVTLERLKAGPAAVLPPDQVLAHMSAFSGQLAKRWNRSTPDIVHAHYWTSGLAALAATRDVSVPVVQTFHTLGVSERRTAQARRLRRPGPADQDGGADRPQRARRAGQLVRRAGGPDPARRPAPVRRGRPVRRGHQPVLPEGPVARRSSKPRLLAVDPLAPRTQSPDIDPRVRRGARLRAGHRRRPGAGRPGRAPGVQAAHGRWPRPRRGPPGGLRGPGQPTPDARPAALRRPAGARRRPYEPFGMAAAGGHGLRHPGDGLRGRRAPGRASSTAPPACWSRRAARPRWPRGSGTLLATPMLLQGYGIAAADRARSRYSWDRIGQETLAVYERSLPGGRLAAGLPGDDLEADGFRVAA